MIAAARVIAPWWRRLLAWWRVPRRARPALCGMCHEPMAFHPYTPLMGEPERVARRAVNIPIAGGGIARPQ